MYVTIHARQYPIEIAEKPLWRNGAACMALLQLNPRRILLSPSLPAADRYRELLHELRHAWTSELGVPGSDEVDARDVATFCDAMTEQLEAQGGRVALMALQPRAINYKGPFMSPALNSRHGCKVCGADTMSGSVRQTNFRMHDAYRVHVADREFDCEACGATNRWTEICDENGVPMGQPCPGVEYQTT